MKNTFRTNRNVLTRRQFVLGTAGAGTLLALGQSRNLQAATTPANAMQTLRGNRFDLNLNYTQVNFTGKPATATTVNGGLPEIGRASCRERV